MKRPPKIIKIYQSIPRNPLYPLQEFRLRVVQYRNSPMLLDIREFVSSENFTGYSPKGVAIILQQVLYVASLLPDVINVMSANGEVHNGNQVPREVKEVTEES